jgi:hypothetical protein
LHKPRKTSASLAGGAHLYATLLLLAAPEARDLSGEAQL